MQIDNQQLPKIGDRVRFRECSFQVSGIIVDEFTDDYVRVQWSDIATSTTHHRGALAIESAQQQPTRFGELE